WSPSSLRQKSRPYCKPDTPPPTTETRTPSPGSPSSRRARFSASAAAGVMVSMGSLGKLVLRKVDPLHRRPQVGHVVVRVVLLRRVCRRVPQLGLHLLGGHPEALLSVGAQAVAKPLPVGARHARPLPELLQLVERPVPRPAALPGLSALVR